MTKIDELMLHDQTGYLGPNYLLQKPSIFLYILVALYRTFLTHLQLCLYDQDSQSYEAYSDGFSNF